MTIYIYTFVDINTCGKTVYHYLCFTIMRYIPARNKLIDHQITYFLGIPNYLLYRMMSNTILKTSTVLFSMFF